ncbi:mucoidy inhibitor MuiA family protein [uncultured Microscilla sp.]|uniref:mucoidy inhibitor MuiA family protein n=1 Tax=uncultured Microscilla sp. TaxID=432653 RepID=UPI00262BDD23|nr:mucoidy inhibitor MuiA family protein [uncultured Microscilla sp.]
MQIIDSVISSVTVFGDRAEVTRTAELSLATGEHLLLFDRLPEKIEQKSVQVNGVGNAVLASVKFKVAHYEEVPDEDKKALMDEQQRLEDELAHLQNKSTRLDNEKKFIENITIKLTTPIEDDMPTLDPAEWEKMFEFYSQKSEALDEAIFANEKEQRTWQSKIEKIEKQLQALKYDDTRTKNQVEVIVQMKAEGSLQLQLSYIVYGAQWKPFYDLRVSTEAKKMNLTYNALVTQNTGEEWQGVTLKLSTAQPQVSGRQPQLQPWRVDVGGRIAKEDLRNTRFEAVADQEAKSEVASMEEAEEDDLDGFGGGGSEQMTKATSGIETGATSVFFSIAGRHTVKSDNTEQQVTVMIEDFGAKFEYSAVPKLSSYAYLRAKVTNNTDYPFLAGSTNIFLDNNFVANASIDTVAATESFWTFLGIDEGMKVERKFLKKYEKKEGKFFGKKTKNVVYEYELLVQNYKKTTEKVTLRDQIPISHHDEIKVHLLLPEYKEDTEQLKKDKLNRLQWTYELAPGKEEKIPFHFALEYPHDFSLTGIEDM